MKTVRAMNLTFLTLIFIVFQPFGKSESTLGMFYVTHEAYFGLVTFGYNVTLITTLNRPLNAGSLCRKRCTEVPTCMAYQVREFSNYSDCTLFRENFCTGAVLINITDGVKPTFSRIWEKMNGGLSATSCISMQPVNMPTSNTASVIASPFNDTLPANFTEPYAPKLCVDYHLKNFAYNGELVPVWPWGYKNGSIKVRCYGAQTAIFTIADDTNNDRECFFWVLDKTILMKPNASQIEQYSSTINFTLLSYLVNLPPIPTRVRKLTFKLICCCGLFGWKEYQETYATFNISNSGSLQLGNYQGELGDGFTSTGTFFPFSASGYCGNFWKFSNSNSCDQKTYLIRHQSFFEWHTLRWNV